MLDITKLDHFTANKMAYIVLFVRSSGNFHRAAGHKESKSWHCDSAHFTYKLITALNIVTAFSGR